VKKDFTLMPTEDGGIDYEEFMKGIIANDMSIMPNVIEEDEIPDEESDAIQSMEDVIKEEGVDVTPEEAEEIIGHAMPLHLYGEKCIWIVDTLLGKLLPHKPDDFIDHIATKICGDKSTTTSSTTSTITTSSNCGGDGGDTRIVQGIDGSDTLDPCGDGFVEIAAPPENWGH